MDRKLHPTFKTNTTLHRKDIKNLYVVHTTINAMENKI